MRKDEKMLMDDIDRLMDGIPSGSATVVVNPYQITYKETALGDRSMNETVLPSEMWILVIAVLHQQKEFVTLNLLRQACQFFKCEVDNHVVWDMVALMPEFVVSHAIFLQKKPEPSIFDHINSLPCELYSPGKSERELNEEYWHQRRQYLQGGAKALSDDGGTKGIVAHGANTTP